MSGILDGIKNTARLILVAATLAGPGVISGQTRVATTAIQNIRAGRNPLGTWSGNSLVTVENHRSAAPVIHVYGDSGQEIQRATVRIPDAAFINIYGNSLARSAEGHLAVICSAYTAGDRSGSFLIIISPDGARQTLIQTNPYVPHAVIFAPDGAVWTVGFEREDGREKVTGYDVLRRFDQNGRLTGSAVARETFPARPEPAIGSWLVTSKDRVGWFSPRGNQYREFTLDGQPIATYAHDMAKREAGKASNVDGVALCDDNGAWVSVEVRDDAQKSISYSLHSLDRTTGTWSGRDPQSSALWLYGCKGTTLAVNSGDVRSIDWIATR